MTQIRGSDPVGVIVANFAAAYSLCEASQLSFALCFAQVPTGYTLILAALNPN